MRHTLYEYACDIVDSWSFETMKEYAETKIYEEVETKFMNEPLALQEEMNEFYEENEPSRNKKLINKRLLLIILKSLS